ncbi:hypothetical protein L2E82_30017 [Cichorium intybus]|uniref:Uncharacterized protein n=1 Tax=Cichorium intybus TaxID=13427 RepID=A0ACB9CZL8_CICIN|nr:hypothetical protein L2E82_30017 [Cichorium intybus]
MADPSLNRISQHFCYHLLTPPSATSSHLPMDASLPSLGPLNLFRLNKQRPSASPPVASHHRLLLCREQPPSGTTNFPHLTSSPAPSHSVAPS